MLVRATLHTLVIALTLLSISHASAQPQTDEFDLLFSEFDARGMSPGEKRFIQAGLAFEGHYRGLLDGAWGRGSQRALEAYVAREFPTDGQVKPEFMHVFAVMLTVGKMIEETGWDDRYFPDLGVSLAAPWGLLHPSSENDLSWETESEDLLVEVFAAPTWKVYEVHNWAENEHSATTQPYLVRRSDRLVTSVRFSSGGGAYLRSDRISEEWASVLIVADEAQHDMLGVIASGVHFGPPRSWRVPEGSLLDRVVDLGVRFLEVASTQESETEREPSVGARQAPRPDRERRTDKALPEAPTATGTGFYVNNTDLVTAAHVIAECERISHEDGAPLRAIASDEGLDLAVLTSPRRSRHWLPLASTGQAGLGERVYVLGYPYYGLIGTTLHATTGNVSALRGVGDNPDFISITAPVQPGNSGGPILNRDGEILGVVSARLSELAIAEATGSLPQNMNYAVSGPRLLEFLENEGVFFPRGRSDPFDMEAGTPETIQRSIVPILCW